MEIHFLLCCIQIMEWMEFRKFNFKHANHAVRLDLTAKVKGIAAAEDYFNSLPPEKRVHCVYGALLNCYCGALMTDKALEVLDTMVREKMVSKSLPYNNLMSMYSRLGQFEKVLALSEEMKKENVEPDTCTYNLLMNSYGQLNDIEGAERAFEEMNREHKKLCNWTSYTNLANIYILAGYREKAKVALQRAEKEMDSKDREAYHYLISLYAGASDLDQVQRIWNLLKSNMEAMTNRSYLIMLEALGRLGDLKNMTKCFKEWESQCSSYDAKLPMAVIRDYLTHDMVEEAEKVLEVAMSKSNGPFFLAWDQIMKYYLDKNQIKRALKILETATNDSKWRPKFVLDRFVDYFKKESDVDTAEEFYKLMKRINCVDSRVYEALLETYEASGETARDMRSRIEADGVEISGEMERLLASVCPE